MWQVLLQQIRPVFAGFEGFATEWFSYTFTQFYFTVTICYFASIFQLLYYTLLLTELPAALATPLKRAETSIRSRNADIPAIIVYCFKENTLKI